MANARVFGAVALAAVLAAGLTGGAAFGQAAEQPAKADKAEMAADKAMDGADAKEKMADGKMADGKTADDKMAMEKAPAAKPAMSFVAGELAVLRRLAERRKALDRREASIVERERLAEAMEEKLAAQAEELKKLQAALAEQEERINAAKAMETDEKKARLENLAKAYKTMKPRDAARLFNDLDMELLTSIASQISPRVLAPVLARMNPERARELTRALQEGGAG